MTKKSLFIMAVFSLMVNFSCASSSDSVIEEPSQPVVNWQQSLCNANATQETKQVFQILCNLYTKKTISGTVANVDWNIREAENVKQWTGRYPALNVFDFINIHASQDVNPNGWLNYSDISVVSDWWQHGGLVGCMWHWQVKANNGSDYTCSPGTNPNETSFDPACIDNTSSADYRQLVKDIDQVAGYLKQMKNAGIPVIWRPLHEAAGNTYEYTGGKAWFWWGAKGAEVYKKLWRFMYDRLVNHHGLNNLIWVWNSQIGDGTWYPGDDVVDVIGRDSYYALQYPLMKEYKQLQKEYPNKLITLAECGNGDEVNMSLFSKIWQQGSRWSWFMTWYDAAYNQGSSDEHQYAGPQWWQDAFATGVVVDRNDMRLLLGK